MRSCPPGSDVEDLSETEDPRIQEFQESPVVLRTPFARHAPRTVGPGAFFMSNLPPGLGGWLFQAAFPEDGPSGPVLTTVSKGIRVTP